MPGPNDSRTPKTGRVSARKPDGVERVIYIVVLLVVTIVPFLAFAFSFGNVGLLGVSLGVDPRIAYLTGPAVDLSVVGLIVAGSYLSHRGRTDRELWPVHVMSVACGIAMIALNCGQAVYEHKWRLASFDAVGPLLLIGWGFLGPWLLRKIADARAGDAPASAPKTVSATAPRPKPETPLAPETAPPLPGASTATAPETEPPIAPNPRPNPAPATATTATSERPAPRPAAPANPRLSTPTDRDRKIRELVREKGRENVDGRIVADALGIHRSNGRLALKKFLEALDGGHISLDDDAEDPDRELVDA